MSDKQSCHFRSRKDQDLAINTDARRMVMEAAGETSGLTIGRQLRKASRALGYPDGSWRVRAAWYFEAACWSARALEDLRARYGAWEDRQAALAAGVDATHAALLRASAGEVERGTDEAVGRTEARAMRALAERLEPRRAGD